MRLYSVSLGACINSTERLPTSELFSQFVTKVTDGMVLLAG